MKTLTIAIILFSLIAVFIFRKDIGYFFEDATQPDVNPRLVNALQGNWTAADDKRLITKINRDSLIQVRNDSIKDAKSLRYLFSEAASKYMGTDNSFYFSETGKSTNNFKLIATDIRTHIDVVYVLNKVSNAEITMTSEGSQMTLIRAKE